MPQWDDLYSKMGQTEKKKILLVCFKKYENNYLLKQVSDHIHTVMISIYLTAFDIFTRNSCIDRAIKIIQVYLGVFNLICDPSMVSILWSEEQNMDM